MIEPLEIWIIKTGEPLPLDRTVRPMRSAKLAQTLAARGHRVTYWASTFAHHGKKRIFDSPTELRLGNPQYALALLHGPPYRKNVSLARVLNHRAEAREFKRRAEHRLRPDIIVCCLPTIDLCWAAIKFGQQDGIPVLIDIRDMWPEVFTFRVPPLLRPLLKLTLSASYRKVRSILGQAVGITAVSQGFVRWGASLAGRDPDDRDAVFQSAYDPPVLSSRDAALASAFWNDRGLTGEQKVLTYVGSLTGRASRELMRFVRLFASVPDLHRHWRLVICGEGDLAEELRRLQPLGVDLPGWRSQAEVLTLLRRSSVGIIPYPNEPDFLATCPNKFAEYLAAGLPILSYLRGEVGRIIRDEGCGWLYRSDEDILRVLSDVVNDGGRHAAQRECAKSVYVRYFQAGAVYGAFAAHIEQTTKRAKSGRLSSGTGSSASLSRRKIRVESS